MSIVAWFSSQPSKLLDLYLSICHIPATSCEVERLFSASGYILSPRRSALKPENLARRSIMKHNTSFLAAYADVNFSIQDTVTKLSYASKIPQNSSAECQFYILEDMEGHDIPEVEALQEFQDSVDEEESSESEALESQQIIPLQHLHSGSWWDSSTAPKSFSHQQKSLQQGDKRRRSSGSTNLPPNKKQKNTTSTTTTSIVVADDSIDEADRMTFEKRCLKRKPALGDEVFIYYPEYCICREKGNSERCLCDIWYSGWITEEKKEEPGYILFEINFNNGDIDEVKWFNEAKNLHWSKSL